MKNPRRIIIFGPQGSGKDTQSERLSRHLKIPPVITGDLFRKEISKRTKIGKIVSRRLKEGKLAPDEITISLVRKKLKEKKLKKGFILNGFPRNLKQAKALDKITAIDWVIELFISDKEGIRRLSGRRLCPVCGATFHLQYKPPKKPGLCDHCRKKLVIREDDKPEIIKKRLSIYHKETEPVL